MAGSRMGERMKRIVVIPDGVRGNMGMIEKVYAFADDAPVKQPAPSQQEQNERQAAAQAKRERRAAKRRT